jgi:uncharacterized protein (TIGR02145 family)
VTLYAKWTEVPPPNGNTFVDSHDGKTYKKVTIGTQTWMAENLNRETANSKCYDNDPSNCATYGRLYTWDDALTACPVGWHLPSDAEWTTLTDYVGAPSGTKLGSTALGGTDNYGFSALPGGYYASTYDSFTDATGAGRWWSATEGTVSTAAWDRLMDDDTSAVERNEHYKTYQFSVRCVGD